MLLINCETFLVLTWSANYVLVFIANADQSAKFSKNDIKIDVPVVTLSTQNKAKLL